jgi:outer membrane protein TolC
MRIYFFIIFSIFILFTGNGHSQVTTVASDSEEFEDYAGTLPPLHALIDSAMLYSPAVRMADNNILLAEYMLKEVRRSMIKQIYVTGDVRYGSNYFITQNETPLIDRITDNQYPVTYGIGLNLRVPLSEVFDKKIQKQKARIGIEQSKIEKEVIENEVRQLVISGYYDLLSLKKTLDMRTEMLTSANMLYEQARLDFANNKISSNEYVQISEAVLTAQNEQEILKNNFIKARYILENLIGIKLNR